jgi:hypothetical protein
MEQMKEKLEECSQYIGTKIVRAGGITRGQFHIAKYGSFDPVRAGGAPEDPGWAVMYEDGYISWCPLETFGKAYRSIRGGCMPFGLAIESLKKGFRVARFGWNGKNMFLFYNPGSHITVQEGRPLAASIPVGTPVDCRPYIMMKTADEQLTIVPWLASQSDMLADDWFIVE